jgi:hypothetical protein
LFIAQLVASPWSASSALWLLVFGVAASSIRALHCATLLRMCPERRRCTWLPPLSRGPLPPISSLVRRVSSAALCFLRLSPGGLHHVRTCSSQRHYGATT